MSEQSVGDSEHRELAYLLTADTDGGERFAEKLRELGLDVKVEVETTETDDNPGGRDE